MSDCPYTHKTMKKLSAGVPRYVPPDMAPGKFVPPATLENPPTVPDPTSLCIVK